MGDGTEASAGELVERQCAVEAGLFGQTEHTFADDVALDLVGTAADRERWRGEEQRVPRLGGGQRVGTEDPLGEIGVVAERLAAAQLQPRSRRSRLAAARGIPRSP